MLLKNLLVLMMFILTQPNLVEKMVCIDISPTSKIDRNSQESLRLDMIKYVEVMDETILMEDMKDMPLFKARKIMDDNLQRVCHQKMVRDFLIMNLVKDSNGQLVWRFNTTAIKSMLSDGSIEDNQMYQMSRGDNIKDNEVLFVYGSKSEYVTSKDIPKIQGIFPKSSFVKITGAGHYLHVEKPKEFLDAVIPFLKES